MRYDGVKTLLVVAVAACAAAPPPPISNRPEGASEAIPSLFAPLFRPRTWSFSGETRVGGDRNNHTTRSSPVDCAIKSTRTLTHAWLADFACTGIVADQPIDGTLIATTAGLWHVTEPIGAITDATVAKLSPLAMLIDADPHPREHTTAVTDTEQESFAVVAAGKGWCASYATNSGDDRGWTICLDATNGLVGGRAFWSGNETTTTQFGAVP